MIPIWPDQETNQDLRELAQHWTTVGHTKVLFPSCLRIKTHDLRTRIGLMAVGKDSSYFELLKTKVEELRKDALTYFITKVGTLSVKKINELMPNVVIADFNHLKIWFRNHGSSEIYLAKLWMAFHGQFDEVEKRGYMKRLSEEYMEMKAIRYIENEPLPGLAGHDKVGCYEALASHAKSKLLAGLNYAGSKSHGWTIKLNRTEDEMKGQKRFKRREAGVTLGSFAEHKATKKVLLNPQEVLLWEAAYVSVFHYIVAKNV